MKTDELLAGLWYGESAGAKTARALLTPASLLFSAAVEVRNVLFDTGVLPIHRSLLPTLSVGNLSVGGTGKTPVAAFFVRALADRGAKPALLMRGYGNDEAEVHKRLNPHIAVVVSPDRYVGAQRAAHDFGCDVIVMDDGFQHRRLARDVDAVILSADSFARSQRMLPGGPLRERLSSLRRATHLIVTRKAADDRTVSQVREQARQHAPMLPQVTISLQPGSLVSPGYADLSLGELRGKRVLLITAIGDPASFEAQVARTGATVRAAVYADHHTFRRSEIESLARVAADHDFAVCTLKDAVKIQPMWPRATTPLWYVSQSIDVEHGADIIDQMLNVLLTTEP